MSDDSHETMVFYELLEDLESQFEDVEVEIMRQQAQMSKDLYEKRQKVVANIPNFWPLVFEAAPQEVDEYIQPSDAAVILSALKSISVSRFELENDPKGEPRSLSIRWEFNENEYFEDTVLEKKFWYRHGLQGYAGLVSEPVDIKWKKGKDLTDGLLSLVKKCWDEEQANPSKAKPKDESELTANQKALKEQVENVAMGGVSFFAWFGYIGQRISAEENKKALEKAKGEKHKREAGDKPEEAEVEEEEEEEDEDLIQSLEIFPDGDDVAYALAEDVWPHAIQYFKGALEQEDMSDVDFEDDDDEDMEAPDLVEIDDHKFEMPPSKKQKK